MIHTKTTRFLVHKKVQLEETVYLSGNSKELGNWSKELSHKLTQVQEDIWSCCIPIPIGASVEYNYFIAKGEEESLMDFCTFNIRYLTNKDEGNLHWSFRKELIKKYFAANQYDVVGVQEATLPQRQHMQTFLKENYQYFGKARNKKNEAENGIFVHLDKFHVLSQEDCWISETKEPGLVGYDALHPRYFTSLTLLPSFIKSSETENSNNEQLPIILVINVHLDHRGPNARKEGLKQIVEKIVETKEKLKKNPGSLLVGCVLMGDFNIREENSQLSILSKYKNIQMKSMRAIPQADRYFTFNGFKSEYLPPSKQLEIDHKLTIDHIYYWNNQTPKSETRFAAKEFCVDRNNENYLSDHFPLIGRFSLSSKQDFKEE